MTTANATLEHSSATPPAPWPALAHALAQTAAAVLQALAACLQDLPTTCPAAFATDGKLRADWVEIVQAQIAGPVNTAY